MKDRTVLASAVIAAVIHAIVLFANLGMTPPTLASAASSIEVTLVAAPAVPAAHASQAAQASAEPTVAPTPRPEPIIEPEPIPEPEPVVIPEPIPEPVPEPAPEPVPEPEPTLFPEPVPEPEPEPVLESEPIPEPDVTATRRAAPEEPGETSEETVVGPPSADSVGEAAEPGGLTENAVPTFDRSPAYTYNPKPKYPRAARRFRREGTVVLLVEVLANGHVGEVAIEESSGHALLDDAAAKAVRRWRFTPAMKGSVPVRASVRVPVEFNLKDAR